MLAHHLGADVFLTDDAAARAVAVQRGLAVAGTIGLLTEARDEGLIPAALPLLLELRRLGQWISEDLLQAVKDEEAERST